MLLLNDFKTSVSRALSEINPKWRSLPGLIICGTHAPHDVEMMIDEIEKARKAGLPFLGICFGYQLAAIEYARNVDGIKNASSEEFSEKGTFVVVKRENIKVGFHEGESWWSNYTVVNHPKFPDNFFVVPFHPEYSSRLGEPHPLLVSFLQACIKYKKHV